MFDLSTGSARDCRGVSRREFLRVGGLSLLGGFTLPRLLRQHVPQPECHAVQKQYIRKLVCLPYRSYKVKWFLDCVPLPWARCTMACNPCAHLVVVRSGSGDESYGTRSPPAAGGQAFRESTLSATRTSQY